MVRDEDIAYHAGNWSYNQTSIGIEHERYNTSNWTEAQFTASAKLVNWLATKYDIPTTRISGIGPASATSGSGILGHAQVPDPNNPSLGGGVSHKTDPANWNWTHYMDVVEGGGLPPTAFSKQSPSNGTGVTSRNVTLTWGASTDPGGGSITYDVTLNTNNGVPVNSWLGVTGTSVSHTIPDTWGKDYYWQVFAKNSSGLVKEADSGNWDHFWANLAPDPTRIISLSGSLAFGNVALGSFSEAPMTISNTGNSALTVSGITYPSGFSGNWSSGMIAVGDSQIVTVTFSPSSASSYGGPITVNSDKTSGTNTISCSGTAIATAIQTWRQNYFGNTANSGDGADMNDFDKDGIPNLLEFAFGLHPKQIDAGMLPKPQKVGSNFVVSFAQPSEVSGVSYGAEWSETLLPGSWISVVNTGVSPQSTFSVPIGTKTKLYMRLKVTNSQ
jgi:hypothetical protein